MQSENLYFDTLRLVLRLSNIDRLNLTDEMRREGELDGVRRLGISEWDVHCVVLSNLSGPWSVQDIRKVAVSSHVAEPLYPESGPQRGLKPYAQGDGSALRSQSFKVCIFQPCSPQRKGSSSRASNR